MVRPYNFMMNINQWAEVAENTIEILMAARFGKKWDMNKDPKINQAKPAFHTRMYIKLLNYI